MTDWVDPYVVTVVLVPSLEAQRLMGEMELIDPETVSINAEPVLQNLRVVDGQLLADYHFTYQGITPSALCDPTPFGRIYRS